MFAGDRVRGRCGQHGKVRIRAPHRVRISIRSAARIGATIAPAQEAHSLHEEKDMTMKRVVTEIGMGTDIRGADYTKAAVRALRDALWHNSLSIAAAIGKPTDSMVVEIHIGVPKLD